MVAAIHSRRVPAAALAVAGLLFVLYPLLRPFSSEVGLDGARAFASSRWVLAHSFGIFAFILLGFGALGLYMRLRETDVGRSAMGALTLMWLGVGLTLPYYGAEAFGLHAVGRRVLAQNDPSALEPLAHAIRFGAGIWFIVAGLLLLGVGGVVLAAAVWRSGRLERWSAIPLAAGLLLYLPQFGGGHSLRIAHGLVLLAGCLWLARELLGAPAERDAARTGSFGLRTQEG